MTYREQLLTLIQRAVRLEQLDGKIIDVTIIGFDADFNTITFISAQTMRMIEEAREQKQDTASILNNQKYWITKPLSDFKAINP